LVATRTSGTLRCSRTSRQSCRLLHPDPRPDRWFDRLDPHAACDRFRHALLPVFRPGNSHAPHQAAKDWIAKFKGQFDQGWDKVREETLERQIKLGIVPAGAVLTPRRKEIPAWDSLNDDQRKV
jgi:arylsulfatase A-like enzyme